MHQQKRQTSDHNQPLPKLRTDASTVGQYSRINDKRLLSQRCGGQCSFLSSTSLLDAADRNVVNAGLRAAVNNTMTLYATRNASTDIVVDIGAVQRRTIIFVVNLISDFVYHSTQEKQKQT
jgi:hypothetical protein